MEPFLDTPVYVGDYLLDRETIRVWRGNKPLKISMRQFRLMELFMIRAGQTLSRKTIKEVVWGVDSSIEEVTVNAEIGRLRRAIGGRKRETPIRTVRSSGYVFEIHMPRATQPSRVNDPLERRIGTL